MAQENNYENYQPVPKVGDYVEKPGTDPDSRFHDFQRRYKEWNRPVDQGGSLGDDDPVVMAFFFGSTVHAEQALEAGLGQPEGRIIEADLDKFIGFLKEAKAWFSAAIRLVPDDERDNFAAADFETSLRLYIMGQKPTSVMRGFLNGACFMRNERSETDLGGGEKRTTTEFYAIPGFDMMSKHRRNLNDPFWGGVLSRLKEASDSANMPMINLDLAIQLRLGEPGSPFYPPQSIGDGFVIFGAN